MPDSLLRSIEPFTACWQSHSRGSDDCQAATHIVYITAIHQVSIKCAVAGKTLVGIPVTLLSSCTCRRTEMDACASSASRQGVLGGRGGACQAWQEPPSGKLPC